MAHFDTHKASRLCREDQMLRNRDPSWRRGSRPQPVQISAYDLSFELKVAHAGGGGADGDSADAEGSDAEG